MKSFSALISTGIVGTVVFVLLSYFSRGNEMLYGLFEIMTAAAFAVLTAGIMYRIFLNEPSDSKEEIRKAHKMVECYGIEIN